MKVLQKQMKLSSAADIVIAPVNTKSHDVITGIISHPMNVKIGRYGCQAAEKLMESQKSQEMIWRASSVHGEQPFVGFAKVFSDKSVTFLRANRMFFYPLHIIVLNYTEK